MNEERLLQEDMRRALVAAGHIPRNNDNDDDDNDDDSGDYEEYDVDDDDDDDYDDDDNEEDDEDDDRTMSIDQDVIDEFSNEYEFDYEDEDIDPFDVTYYKRIEDGAVKCMGRNIIGILDDRSTHGSRYTHPRWMRARISTTSIDDATTTIDDNGMDEMEVGRDGGSPSPSTTDDQQINNDQQLPNYYPTTPPQQSPCVYPTIPSKPRVSLAFTDPLPTSIVHEYSKEFIELKNKQRISMQEALERGEHAVNYGTLSPYSKVDKGGNDDEDDDNDDNDDEDNDDDEDEDVTSGIVNITSEIASYAEYAAATKFKANYLTHLNGGLEVPKRPRGFGGGGGGGGRGGGGPAGQRRAVRQNRFGLAAGGGLPSMGEQVVNAYTREQNETNRQLREHLRTHGLGIPVHGVSGVIAASRNLLQPPALDSAPGERGVNTHGRGGMMDNNNNNNVNDVAMRSSVVGSRGGVRSQFEQARRAREALIVAARRMNGDAAQRRIRRRNSGDNDTHPTNQPSESSQAEEAAPPQPLHRAIPPPPVQQQNPPNNQDNHSSNAPRSVSTISIAFAPDSRTVASTHGDHTVKISCCYTGKLIRTLEGHPRTPWTVKYHPTNSRIVASGCLGFQVRVWDWNYQKESVRKARRVEGERRWRGRYDDIKGRGGVSLTNNTVFSGGGGWGGGGGADTTNSLSTSPRGVVEHPWRVNRGGGRDADDCFGFSADNDLSAANTTTKKLFSEEEDDYASSVLFNAGIPSDDPAWFDIESEAFNYGTGMGVCLNMVRLHSAVISLSFHPSGEILAMASGNTLHLWDYNAEKRKKIQKELDAATAASVGMGFHPNGAAIGLESPSPSRESEARILNRSETSVFPRTPMIDFQHNTPLRCVHFPPCGTVIIVGGVNPASANEGLPSARDPRRRGGMSGGGMSFYLRIFDFNLDTLLNPTSVVGEGRALQRGGRINDEGDLEHDFTIDKDVLCNPRKIIPRVLLYNDGGFDVSQDGKVLSACADFWLPDGIDSAMELMESQQRIDDAKPDTTDDNDIIFYSPSRSPTSSPPPRQQQSLAFPDPRTPPPNVNMHLALEPPSPPGKRNMPNMPRTQPIHFPHPLSIVAANHPAHKEGGGRYVPHIVTVSLDTSMPPNGEPLPLNPKIVRTESMRRFPNLGKLLQAAPLDGAKSAGVTCVKLSPTAEYCLLGYGVRENIPSVHENEETRHPVTSLYNVKRGMKHVCTLTCADDDVNIARFHPESGHGFVYGTKQGRVRVLAKRPWNYYHLEE